MSDQNADRAKLVELIGDIPIAMLTTYGGAGVRSVPMARQEVEPDAEMWFIAARDTKHVADIQVEPRVSLTFSSRDARVALTGTAVVVEDDARLKELWNTFAEAWLPGGPRGPERGADQGRRRRGGVLGHPRRHGRLADQLRENEVDRRHLRHRPRGRQLPIGVPGPAR